MWISLKKKRLIDFFFGFLFLARSLLLHLGFSSCGERGLLLSWSVGLSLPWLLLWWSASSGRVASAVAARRLRSCDLQALGRELSSCGAQAWLLQRVRDHWITHRMVPEQWSAGVGLWDHAGHSTVLADSARLTLLPSCRQQAWYVLADSADLSDLITTLPQVIPTWLVCV